MNKRAEDLVDVVRTLPRREQLRLVERIIHGMTETDDTGNSETPSLVGCFADNPALIDEIEATAMAARERDPLRRPGA